MVNPRFPHRIEVFRELLDEEGNNIYDEKGNPMFDKVFESICGQRQMDREIDIDADVTESDYKLAMPKHSVIIKKSDSVKFYNSYICETIEGRVTSSKIYNFGANLFFKSSGN